VRSIHFYWRGNIQSCGPGYMDDVVFPLQPAAATSKAPTRYSVTDPSKPFTHQQHCKSVRVAAGL
jgi:hypothetical protein